MKFDSHHIFILGLIAIAGVWAFGHKATGKVQYASGGQYQRGTPWYLNYNMPPLAPQSPLPTEPQMVTSYNGAGATANGSPFGTSYGTGV